MSQTKKKIKEDRRMIRLQKGAEWLAAYQGTRKHLMKHYREKFHVDVITASQDLAVLGVNYSQEQLDGICRGEEERIRQKQLKKPGRSRNTTMISLGTCVMTALLL